MQLNAATRPASKLVSTLVYLITCYNISGGAAFSFRPIDACPANGIFRAGAGFHPISTPVISRATSSLLSMSSPDKNLVSIQDGLQAHATDPRAIFIDGSWHMPVGESPRNGRAEYQTGPRIAGAKYFDIDDVAAPKGSQWNPKELPHMMPPKKLFAAAMDALGITPDDTIYVYPTQNCAFYHRAYYTLRSCGHPPEKVKLIQGSLKEWMDLGGPVETHLLKDGEGNLFRAENLDWENSSPKYVCENEDDSGVAKHTVDMEEVLAIVNEPASSGSTAIVDARSFGRFVGVEPEPRPGLRGGHMKGSFNVPFTSLLNPDDPSKFRSTQEMKDIFSKAGKSIFDSKQKIICTCGSGVTAAALAVALEECGLKNKEDVFIYDGSWIEWGGDLDNPVIKDE